MAEWSADRWQWDDGIMRRLGMHRKNNRLVHTIGQKGYTLVELIVTFALFAIFMTAVVMCLPSMTKIYMQLQQINALSFAVDDASLFLDTHPDNAEAMRYFLDANMQRRNALNAYQAQFGPLFIDSVTGQGWSWETEKWPWEGGY